MDGTSTKKRYTVEELKKSGHEPVRKIKLILASEPKLSYPEGSVRPKTRGDCKDGPRPCVFVSCRYNMFLEVSKGGGIRHNFPGIEPEEMVNSCALDLAEKGGMSMEETAKVFGVAKERIRQIELEVQGRMRRAFSRNGEEVVNTREAQNWNLLRSYLKKE